MLRWNRVCWVCLTCLAAALRLPSGRGQPPPHPLPLSPEGREVRGQGAQAVDEVAPPPRPAAPNEGTRSALNKLPPLPSRELSPEMVSALNPVVTGINLHAALMLGGVQNPQILIARQRVLEAVAERQRAAAFILPTFRPVGSNYDSHTGPLQQSSGNILSVKREAVYVGSGANAVAAGTVAIPGLQYNLNVALGIYGMLSSRQLVVQRQFASRAAENQALGEIASAYLELLRAEGRRAAAIQTRQEAQKIAGYMYSFARTGVGTPADADRADTELERRDTEVLQADSEVQLTSARLAELVNLDPAIRLQPQEDRLWPTSLVPDPIPLPELLAIAITQRPELGEMQAAIQRTLLDLGSARVLPFSPNVIVGYSAGGFGGGSNLVASNRTPRFGAFVNQPYFGNFEGRDDMDVIAFWTLANLGVGNRALINLAKSRVGIAKIERLRVLNRVREEVTDAYVRAQARFAELRYSEETMKAGLAAYTEDSERFYQGGPGPQGALPVEVLDDLRLLAQGREDYVNAIAAYNRAQLELYVAIGLPPADVLARPIPRSFPTAPPLGQDQKRAAPGGNPPAGPAR
jgi:outer membrane protein TolC